MFPEILDSVAFNVCSKIHKPLLKMKSWTSLTKSLYLGKTLLNVLPIPDYFGGSAQMVQKTSKYLCYLMPHLVYVSFLVLCTYLPLGNVKAIQQVRWKVALAEGQGLVSVTKSACKIRKGL